MASDFDPKRYVPRRSTSFRHFPPWDQPPRAAAPAAPARRCVETLKRGELPTEREVKELCYRARDILVEESNVQRVSAPVTVCLGDARTAQRAYPAC